MNFNGTGTVAIRDSHNVSSITDNGTGQYTINFSNNLANGNFSVTGMPDGASGNSGLHTIECGDTGGNSASIKILTAFTTGGTRSDYDSQRTNVTVFGD